MGTSPITCAIGTDVRRAAAILRDGGLVVFPTETVYGLGGLALETRAVAKIFAAKDRPRFDPLIVHIADPKWLGELVTSVPEMANRLIAEFWPGPLTFVLPKTAFVPDLVTSGLPTVAVRIPDHPLALELLCAVDQPVAAPSANRFGCLSPTRAEHVIEQLGDRIDYVLDGGPCRVGLESTVLDLSGETPTLLRPGGLTVEQIEAVIGPVTIPALRAADEPDSASSPGRASPGLLSKHYAPTTPLSVTGDFHCDDSAQRIGLLVPGPISDAAGFAAVEVLSATGDLTESAARFFAALRRLDTCGLDRILAVPFPETGLGRALNDRLRRAAHD